MSWKLEFCCLWTLYSLKKFNLLLICLSSELTVGECGQCQVIDKLMISVLQQLASHGLFDLCVKASGDIHIDDHHTNEDVALAIGTVKIFVDFLYILFCYKLPFAICMNMI